MSQDRELKNIINKIKEKKKELNDLELEKSKILVEIYKNNNNIKKLNYFKKKDDLIVENDIICENDSGYEVSSENTD